MNVVEYPDATQLWKVAEPLLCKDVANNTHTLSALRRLARDGAQHGERFFALHDAAGALQATLVRTDIGHAFLSHLSADDACALGAALAARDLAELALAGVVGVRDSVEAFARAYAKPTTSMRTKVPSLRVMPNATAVTHELQPAPITRTSCA